MMNITPYQQLSKPVIYCYNNINNVHGLLIFQHIPNILYIYCSTNCTCFWYIVEALGIHSS